MAEYNDIEKRRNDMKWLLENECITQDGYETAMINLDKIEKGIRRDR